MDVTETKVNKGGSLVQSIQINYQAFQEKKGMLGSTRCISITIAFY